MPSAAAFNPANLLTAARLVMAPAIVIAIVGMHTWQAGVLFVLAVASDMADGPLARRRGATSAFGGLFDHAVDAAFVTLMLAALAWRGDVTGWLPVLVAASFTQYVLDSQALRGRKLRTSRLGRSNGIAYYVAGGIPIIRDALTLDWPATPWVQAFAWWLVLTSVLSMAERAWVYWRTRRVIGREN